MKHLKVFSNLNEYETSEVVIPRVSLIKDSGVLMYEDVHKAGTILMMNNNGDKKWLSLSDYQMNSESLIAQGYSTIGVVVVPSNHTEDGTCRVISVNGLNNRGDIFLEAYDDYYFGDINTFESVAVLEHKHNTEGDYDYGYEPVFGEKQTCTYVNPEDFALENNYGTYAVPTFATDYEFVTENEADYSDYTEYIKVFREKTINPYDSKTFWYTFDSSSFEESSNENLTEEHYLMPSPYINGNQKNLLYHSGGNKNALSDMNGKENTSKIIYNLERINGGFLEDTLYFNVYNFSTVGTKKGDWYIPSFGEVGYLLARADEILKSLRYINPELNFDLGDYEYGSRYETILGHLVTSTFLSNDYVSNSQMYLTGIGYVNVHPFIKSDEDITGVDFKTLPFCSVTL